jgi:putative transposase
VRRKLGVSERRACRAVGQARSTQRYAAEKVDRDRVLAERMMVLSQENPRYGYRRVWAMLKREGWTVNKKRVHRLWREEGLKVPHNQRRRRRLLEGTSENGCVRRKAESKDHVWSYDFVMDRTENGRRLKMMPVVDEHTRECLSIEVERSITAEDVIGTLARLFHQRGAPAFIRSDNGPEFVAAALKRWLEASGVGTSYIEPGSPWENAYTESFIGRLGDELLKRETFSRAWWKRRSWLRSIASTTTSGVRTALWATARLWSLRRRVEWHGRVRSLRRSYNRQQHSHSSWYRKRGPVKRSFRNFAS